MIGYYVHHHGFGHLARATSIAGALDEPVTILTSRPRTTSMHGVEWVDLPLDHDSADTALDPTANGALHWAPIGVAGLGARAMRITQWLHQLRPSVVVVDVSVEVAVLVRLAGVPVVVMAMPGERLDPAHQLAYRLATRIIAPWSSAMYDPPWLHDFADKTHYVGSISRFENRSGTSEPNVEDVLVLGGAGGSVVTAADIDDAARHTPRYRWVRAGVDGASWVDDVWPQLCAAGVVVTHAGQNAIADVACAGVPAVVVPQDRPFGEQRATGAALAAAGVAVVLPRWPDAASWPAALEEARRLDGTLWQRLETAGAAGRAAAAVVAAAGARMAPR